MVVKNCHLRFGIAAGRDSCYVRPQPLLNKDIKVKDNKQKPSIARPARTAADKRTAAEDNNVPPCLQQYLC